MLSFAVEFDRTGDGGWIARIPDVPQAQSYGRTPAEAKARAQAYALATLDELLEEPPALTPRPA